MRILLILVVLTASAFARDDGRYAQSLSADPSDRNALSQVMASSLNPENFGKRPSVMKTVEGRSLCDTVLLNEVVKVPFSAFEHHLDACSAIAALFAECRPPAILGTVVAIVVDPFDLCALEIGGRHVFEKICEDLPSLADLNAPCAVTRPFLAPPILTSLLHGEPNVRQGVSVLGARQTHEPAGQEATANWMMQHGRSVPFLIRDDGRWKNSDLKPWFDSLRNKHGMGCCSDADGVKLDDPEWRCEGADKCFVKLNGVWQEVPEDAILETTNRVGYAMVWRLPGSDIIRCFLRGSES